MTSSVREMPLSMIRSLGTSLRTSLSLPQLSERDRRALQIGATLIVVGALVFRGVPAWLRRVNEERTRATRLVTHVAQVRARTTLTNGTTQLAGTLDRQSLALAPAFLHGDTPAQASATLASYISETAEAAGVRLGTVQISVDTGSKRAELYHVRLRVDATGDVRGITTWLSTLESGSAPLLAVRAISVSQSDPAAPSNRPEQLRASLDVEGIARRDADGAD